MEFTEVLKSLKKGLPARRSGLTQIASIRLISPSDTPGVDGPEVVHILMSPGGRIDSEEHEDPKAAKAALAALQKAHKAKWDDYTKCLTRWETTPADKRDEIPPSERPVQPGYPSDFYTKCEVKEVSASRRYRLNVPYFIAVTKDGRVEPYILSTTDLLAQDWAVA